MTYNIGSFEGGGTRGIMQATILAALHPRLDLVAGTSVGSIAAACYAVGVTDITTFFTEQAPKIFAGAWWIPLPRLWRSAKYPPDGLRAGLTSVLGAKTLADCTVKFFASAIEMKTGRRVLFRSYGESSATVDRIIIGPDSGMPLVDVCMASSAAQTYFPGHAWSGYLFWDGGSTGFNAPDMLALNEARQFAADSEIQMLSLGNGQTPWPYAGQDMTDPGIATVAEATATIAYSGPESAMVMLARNALGSRHYRLDPAIPNYAIDDASPDTLSAMQGAARAAFANQPGLATAFA